MTAYFKNYVAPKKAALPTNDWILRCRFSGSGSTEVLSARPEIEVTRRIAEYFLRHDFVVSTLGAAVDSLKRSVEFNGVYNAFLLEQITEEDFEQMALDFEVEPTNSNQDLVAEQIQILMDYTSSEFTRSEIAEILSTTDEVVDSAIEQLCLFAQHKDSDKQALINI